MIRDQKYGSILVLLLILCNGTTGGSWKKLEKLFIQDHDTSEHWDENRIIFPDTVEDTTESRWRSTPRGDSRRSCEDNCAVSREYSPVCGTNGVTYQNMDQLLCAMRCGEDVDLHRPSACWPKLPKFTTTTPAPPITCSTATTTTERSEEVERCIRGCPSTPEYNPVCGTDYVTYNNMGKLQCAKICGIDVNFWRHSRCPIRQSTTTVASTTIRNQENVRTECLLNCHFTTEYNPVCGTDNLTYYNIGRLECAKFCGVDVSMLRQGRCKLIDQTYNNFGPTTSEDYFGDDSINPRFLPRDQTLRN